MIDYGPVFYMLWTEITFLTLHETILSKNTLNTINHAMLTLYINN